MASYQSGDLRRPRKIYSCEPCRRSKLRCDRQAPCSSCKHRDCEPSCTYRSQADAVRGGHTQTGSGAPRLPSYSSRHGSREDVPPISELGNHSRGLLDMDASTATNTGQECSEFTHAHWNAVLERPMHHTDHTASEQRGSIAQVRSSCFPFTIGPRLPAGDMLSNLPPWPCCEYLITRYFTHLSPLFHVLHGPTFEHQYYVFRDDPTGVDLSWLALLFLVMSITLHTMENDDTMLAELWPEHSTLETGTLSRKFRTEAMVCLAQDNFLTNHRLSTLEALLILIYTISHDEGVDRCWVLLGMALNIGIAQRCHVDSKQTELNCVEVERRRRCWAGILLLHTYQAIIFQDVETSWLMNIPAVMPADVNDKDIHEHIVVRSSSQPTQMSVMIFKLRLFQLSTRVCDYLSDPPKLDKTTLGRLDAEIAVEQRKWDSTLLSGGRPSILDTSSYAFWAILQLYAHQLYLLIHTPFCRSKHNFRPESRSKCILSSTAMLDFHQQFCELPRLRCYRWNVYGMMSSYALHGAVALASCLLDWSDKTLESVPYRAAFDSALVRFEKLQDRSPICKKAYPILRHLQTLLSPKSFQLSNPAGAEFGNTFDNWIDSVQWFNPDSIDWNFWDGVLNEDDIHASHRNNGV